MVYQWDQRKASSNARKHGIYFSDAVVVFEDDLALTIPDDFVVEERLSLLVQMHWAASWWLSTRIGEKTASA